MRVWGRNVRIWLEPDLEERAVLLPPELARELNSDRKLRRWFDRMSDSMRREIGKWADEPKTAESRRKRAEKMAERLMQAMEGEEEPPPVLRAAFLRQPLAERGWFALTPTQRRSHLLGIFYYETADARERRAAKAIEDALRAAKRVSGRATSVVKCIDSKGLTAEHRDARSNSRPSAKASSLQHRAVSSWKPAAGSRFCWSCDPDFVV